MKTPPAGAPGILKPEDLSVENLPRNSHCIFLNSEDRGEKLSGGFYCAHFRHGEYEEKFDAYFAVTWILAGGGLYRDYRGNASEIVPGMLLVRHAGTEFALDRRRFSGDWLEYSAALPRSFYLALRAAEIVLPEETLLNPGLSVRLLELASQYVEVLPRADAGEGRNLAFRRFLEFYALARELSRRQGNPEPTPDETLVETACMILGGHFEQTLSMNDVARKRGMGYETFRKKFVRLTGVSPNEYRIRKRLEKADSLLLQTRLPIKEIAGMLGYSDVAVFSRQYRAFRRCAPGTMRNDGEPLT